VLSSALVAKHGGTVHHRIPIDLDPQVFGPGDIALTLVGHINVHLWQADRTPTYEFAVPCSFAASFCEWLFAASAKYGLLVRAA